MGGVGRIVGQVVGPAVLVGLAVLVVAPRWTEVHAAGGLPSAGVTVVVAAANVVANVGLARTWVALVRTGTPDVDVAAAVRAHAVSLPARYLAPGGHIPARAAAARRHGLPVAAGVGLGGVELLLSVLILSLLSLVTLPGWMAVDDAGRTAWLAVLPAGAALALLVAPDRTMALAGGAVRILGSPFPSGPVDRLVRQLDGGGMETGRRSGRLVRGVALRYVGVLGVRGLGFVVLGVAVAGRADGRGVAALLGAFAVSNLVGRVVVIAPAGLGVREAMLTAVLAPTVGLGPAGAIALLARLLDALAEAVFVGAALLWRGSGPADGFVEGARLVLPDATIVVLGTVHQRTWSRVANGLRGSQRVWCKQHLDRRRRPDPTSATAQARAANRAAAVGLPAVPPVAVLGDRAVTVHPWIDVEVPGDRLLELLALLPVGRIDGTGTVPLFGVDAVMAGPSGPVLLDLPDRVGTVEQQAAELVASALRTRWGRPLRGFVAGPDWAGAAAVAAMLPVRPRLDAVEQAHRSWWRARQGEWVGRTRLDAASRLVGVHTVGLRYHLRVLDGLRSGRLVLPPDRAASVAPVVEVGP